jgi:hypothetical protein
MKNQGIRITEIIIASTLTSICSICAYYLHSVNQNIMESKELWKLGSYRIEQLEKKVDKIESFPCKYPIK